MSTLGMYYDGTYHDLSNYVLWPSITEYPSGNNHYFTNFTISAPFSDHSFLDVASALATALYEAEQGDDLVRLVRTEGSDAQRFFSVWAGSVVRNDDSRIFRHYTVSVEHVAESEVADSVDDELSMNVLYYGIDRVTAVTDSNSTGDRPARIAEMVVHSDIAGLRINKFWAGFKPDLDTFNANIDFPTSFTGIGNERSNDTTLVDGLVEISFNETEEMLHRFESKFGFTYSPGGGNPDQTTYWNTHTLSNPEKYPGKYRLLMRWNASNITSSFLIKVYAGYKDALQFVATKHLQATYASKTQTVEIGQIELPGDADLDHYSIRVSAARLDGVGKLRFDIGRIIPYEYSLYCGSDNMRVRAGTPETTLTVETDTFDNVTAYAKGAYDTTRPQLQTNNWSNPGGIMVVHVDGDATESALDSQDALTINLENYHRYGLHTPYLVASIPTVAGSVG